MFFMQNPAAEPHSPLDLADGSSKEIEQYKWTVPLVSPAAEHTRGSTSSKTGLIPPTAEPHSAQSGEGAHDQGTNPSIRSVMSINRPVYTLTLEDHSVGSPLSWPVCSRHIC